MRVGYRITYFVDGDEPNEGVSGLPDHVFCDGTLDESLRRIKEALQTWVEAAYPPLERIRAVP